MKATDICIVENRKILVWSAAIVASFREKKKLEKFAMKFVI